MFKINTEQELYDFLRILSEESVKKSKKLLNEDPDPYNSYYLNKRKQEKNMFEQDLDPTAEDEKAQDSSPEPEAEPEPDKAAEQEPEEKEQTPSGEKFIASKDRLVDFVNDIRSAPSIKDSAVSEQIDAYYDRLSEEERNVLVFFLRELSKVMTGKASGSDARDPSDPPLSIDFVPKGEEQEEPASGEDAESGSEADQIDQSLEPAQDTSDEEAEDTSAPIRVNESQDHSRLRAKIINLLL